jgi:hypothetical protein
VSAATLTCATCGRDVRIPTRGRLKGAPVHLEPQPDHSAVPVPVPARRRIAATWSIKPGVLRVAVVPREGVHEELTLHASNMRVAADGGWVPDIYGPVRWLVASATHGTVATGRVYQGVEYQALQRQAMLEAEAAAAAYRERQAVEAAADPGEGLEAQWEQGLW